MKICTLLKYVLKIIIFTTFIGERFFYYKKFIVEKSDKKNIHHELVGGWEIDFSKVDSKFSDHQFFKLPYASKITDEIKKYLVYYWNLHYNSPPTRHTHSKDSVHTFSDKVIDNDMRFKFYFLTGYDFTMMTVLIYFLFSESKIAGLLYLCDVCLKNYCLFYDPSFNSQLKNLVTAHFNFKEFSDYICQDLLNILKIVNFFSTFFFMFSRFLFREVTMRRGDFRQYH